jgi:hypothetical protein
MEKPKVVVDFIDQGYTLEDHTNTVGAGEGDIFVILDMNSDNGEIKFIIRKLFEKSPWFHDHHNNELIMDEKFGLTLAELDAVSEEIEKYGFIPTLKKTKSGSAFEYDAIPNVKHLYSKSPKRHLKDFLFITEIANNLDRRSQLSGWKTVTMVRDWKNELQKKCKVKDCHVRALHAQIAGKENW